MRSSDRLIQGKVDLRYRHETDEVSQTMLQGYFNVQGAANPNRCLPEEIVFIRRIHKNLPRGIDRIQTYLYRIYHDNQRLVTTFNKVDRYISQNIEAFLIFPLILLNKYFWHVFRNA